MLASDFLVTEQEQQEQESRILGVRMIYILPEHTCKWLFMNSKETIVVCSASKGKWGDNLKILISWIKIFILKV